METTADRIKNILQAQFQPLHLEIVDESAQHAGHPGAASGGGHYRVTVVSSRFEQLSPLAQHRLVNEALSHLLGGEVHALSLTTLTPAGWKG